MAMAEERVVQGGVFTQRRQEDTLVGWVAEPNVFATLQIIRNDLPPNEYEDAIRAAVRASRLKRDEATARAVRNAVRDQKVTRVLDEEMGGEPDPPADPRLRG